MPPPSSGGVALVEMMNMLALVDLDSIAFNTTAYFHLLTEVMRRAFADRAEFLGDPDFNDTMPIDRLTSKTFAQQRMAHLDWNQASVSDPVKFGQIYDGENTTHLSVVDVEGNAVSLTYTLEQSYGSGMGSPELGFLLNNEMGDFNPQYGYTDRGWLIGTAPNKIEPGKRMLSSMTPTIVAKEGKPYLIIGSPGGRTIISTVFQTVLAVLAYDMPLHEAIEAVKIHQPVSRDQLGRLMGILVDQVRIGAVDSSSPDGAAIGY
jgi:gamma-glutamyltranspeptidase/glutathione hydrolase